MKVDKDIKLNDIQKAFVVKYLQPLLKKNDLLGVREILSDYDKRAGIDDMGWAGQMNIQLWLMQHIDEKLYFRGSNKIFEDEFLKVGEADNSASDIKFSMVLPSHIKVIEDDAFINSCLEKITLNEGLEEIGERALQNTYLKSLIIPSSVKSIGTDAIGGNEFFKSVKFTGNNTITLSPWFMSCLNEYSVDIYWPKNKKIQWDDYDDDFINTLKSYIIYY